MNKHSGINTYRLCWRFAHAWPSAHASRNGLVGVNKIRQCSRHAESDSALSIVAWTISGSSLIGEVRNVESSNEGDGSIWGFRIEGQDGQRSPEEKGRERKNRGTRYQKRQEESKEKKPNPEAITWLWLWLWRHLGG